LNKRTLLLTLFLIFSIGSSLKAVQSQTGSDLNSEILLVFNEISKAEESGAEVSSLVEELNQIITLVNNGDETALIEANNRLSLLSQASQEATLTGTRTTQNELITTIVIGLATIVASILAWIYTPRAFWTLWLQVKRNWIVEN
jgi:hypothetical protein